MSGRDLQDDFHFTEKDLTVNRTGQLSEIQAQRFLETNMGCIRIVVGTTIVLGIAAFLIFLFGPSDIHWGGLMLLGLTLFSLALSVVVWRSRNDGIYLFQIEGAAELRVDHSDGAKRYTLSIKGYDFTLDSRQYEALEAGNTYRVYYAAMDRDPRKQKTTSKLIQSLERIQGLSS